MERFAAIVNSWELLYNFAAKLFILDVCVGPDYLGLLWVLFVRLFSESHKSTTNKKAYFPLKAESLQQYLALLRKTKLNTK